MVVERMPLKALQRYHHATLNRFGEHETLVDAIASRPGFFGPNPVAFLSIAARRKSTHLGDLDEALLNDRSLVRATAFRTSLLLMSAADYPIYFRALLPLLKNIGMERLARFDISESHLMKFAKCFEEANFVLPQTHEALMKMIFTNTTRRPPQDAERLIVRKLCDLGVLIRAATKGWKGNDFTYALTKNWLSEIQLGTENPEAARTETIRRYLRAYGPATVEDVGWWTGLPLIQVQRSVLHLRREAVRIPVDGYKDDLIGLRDTVDQMRSPTNASEQIQFLPPWDPYTFGWVQRRRVIDKEWMPWVFDMVGNSSATIVEAGKVIGVWQFRDSAVNILEIHVFAPYLSRRREVFKRAEEYALLLGELSAAATINIMERPLQQSLLERPLGSFLWPLGKELPFKVSDQRVLDSPMERRTSNTFRGSYLDAQNVVRGTESAGGPS
jgi:hypothetical protein